MKFKFNLKNKEVDFEAGVEGLVAKGIERKEKIPIEKLSTRFAKMRSERMRNSNKNKN